MSPFRPTAPPSDLGSLILRLDAQDRALFARCALDERHARWLAPLWTMVTHLGGTAATLGVCALLALPPRGSLPLAFHALLVAGISHVVVQLVKRFAARPRPLLVPPGVCATLVRVPDRFSFPSGHACAAMSIALVLAWTFPPAAIPLLLVALAVGASRVVLGVHYPGDVLAGQAIAMLVAAAAWILLR